MVLSLIRKVAITAFMSTGIVFSAPMFDCSGQLDIFDTDLTPVKTTYTLTVISMSTASVPLYHSQIMSPSSAIFNHLIGHGASTNDDEEPASHPASKSRTWLSEFASHTYSPKNAGYAVTFGQTSKKNDRHLCSKITPCTGDLTFYDTAIDLSSPSACNTTNDGRTEFVVALPHGLMTSSHCGKTINIIYDGQVSTGTVVDKCIDCDDQSIDLSRVLFQEFGPMEEGRLVGATWYIE
jgi:hypothetical protein